MNWLARIFAQAFARRIALVVVALLLAWCGVGKAHAQNLCRTDVNINIDTCATGEEAYNAANATAAQKLAQWQQSAPSIPWAKCTVQVTTGTPDQWFGRVYRTDTGSCTSSFTNSYQRTYPDGVQCTNGKYWDPNTNSCKLSCPGGYTEDPWNAGQCLDQDKCQARNALEGFKDVGSTTRLVSSGDTTSCVGGCQFRPMGPSQRLSVPGGLQDQLTGEWQFPGDSCAAGTPEIPKEDAINPKPQECVAVSGQSVCVKRNGEMCASASTGKQFCWGPGETGTKTDGPDLQKRDPGNQPIPPNLQIPNGDSLTQQGQPVTTVTKSIDANGNVVITVTTTTTNYQTVNGTNASGGTDGNQGEPSDGTGSPAGDGTGNSSSGGGDCATPPVNTGDPLLSQIAVQTWHTRCDASTRDSELRSEAAGLDTADGSAGHEGDVNSLWNEDSGADYIADESGFGFGNTCPAPPEIAGRTLDWAGLCDLMGMVGLLVLAAAHMHALYIIAGD